MATSKNNRKKGKKRAKTHAAPAVQHAQDTAASKRTSGWKSEKTLDFIALLIMVAGFALASLTSYGIVGYPIAALGAAVGLVRTKWDTTNHKITIVCYIVIIVLLMLTWFGMLGER